MMTFLLEVKQKEEEKKEVVQKVLENKIQKNL
jgi:hypothetical protein